jgi:ABC-type polysaccharide/polyol phosphate export permease
LGNIVVCLLPFTLFQGGVLSASHSLVGYQDILRRHSVNRVVFPMSTLGVAAFEYLVASSSLLVLGPLLGLKLTSSLAVLPLGFACLLASAVGLGLLGSIGTVYFRDLGHLIQVSLNLLYWLTPIVYTLSMIPEPHRKWFYLNPLVSMLAMYTEPLVYGRWPAGICLWIGPVSAVVLLVAGWLIFARHARRVVFYL